MVDVLNIIVSVLLPLLRILYDVIVYYVAVYPAATSVIWIFTSIIYYNRWEDDEKFEGAESYCPFVSVIIPSFNEAEILSKSLHGITSMDYPNYEVMLIIDGSNDNTIDVAQPFIDAGKIRVLHKMKNQGKAMGINDALPCTTGEIVIILDADADPNPDFISKLVPHFIHPRVGVVTAHPIVRNTGYLLTRLQLIEFSSIMGLLRRSQRIWGRITTVSGISSAFRRGALNDVGGFVANAYTEDIEITWRLQKRFWDVRYEPSAIAKMVVPETPRIFLKQRLRWARGLMQVLSWNVDILLFWKYRRMWIIFWEAALSTIWVLLFSLVPFIELARYLLGHKNNTGFYLQWGIAVATIALVQLFVGLYMESNYDKNAKRFAPYAILYVLFYWLTMVFMTLAAFPVIFKTSRKAITWDTGRR